MKYVIGYTDEAYANDHSDGDDNHGDGDDYGGVVITECDISVLKLLGFETFPIFWMVSDSVSK